jgi:hypothetical protein
MSESSAAVQDRRPRSASSFSDKQILAAAKHSKVVTVSLPSGETVEGWICGLDAFHWGVVDSSGRVYLIHKSVPSLQIGAACEMPELAAKIAGPFQSYANNN